MASNSTASGAGPLSRVASSPASTEREGRPAAEAGAARPDPALFHLAMDWAGATPDETLHVGDDPHRDVEAARAIGITAVWVNRNANAWPAELAPPAHQISDLGALPARLAAAAPGLVV